MYKKGLLLDLIKNPIATAVSFAANDLIKEYMHAQGQGAAAQRRAASLTARGGRVRL